MTLNDKITPVVVGGVLTVVGTLIIQAAVVPAVQARTRRREQWEDAVTELANLAADRLPSSVDSLTRAADSYRLLKLLDSDDPKYDKDRLLQATKGANEELKAAVAEYRVVNERARVLITRVKRYHRHAPEWRKLDRLRMGLDLIWVNFSITH